MENSWPFQWYQLIPCQKERVICELNHSEETIEESDSEHCTATQTSWLRSRVMKLRLQALRANLHQQKSSAALSLMAAGSLHGFCCSAAISLPLMASSKGNERQQTERRKAEITSEVQPKRCFAKQLDCFSVEPVERENVTQILCSQRLTSRVGNGTSSSKKSVLMMQCCRI